MSDNRKTNSGQGSGTESVCKKINESNIKLSWFIGISVCTIMCLLELLYFRTKYCQAENRTERLQTELDSIKKEHRLYKAIIDDLPKELVERWIEDHATQ